MKYGRNAITNKKTQMITNNEAMRQQGVRKHFELADGDDFFGFDRAVYERRDAVRRNRTLIVSGMVLLAAVSWAVLGSMQRQCLDRNAGDITKCD